ncbi:hypothetical protein TVAG_460740 [Trichomonas vaginalis G3]|uniref:Uncharacterized protein n=1 Tax=Trichomonas vaginalis (strain ATCC PRA-98 / G3) TaxID=412133 RepID=A2DY48_TRIV3|nr:nerve growth factor signaling pathway [Trichomonas vaginalis G3]EAY14657.1 hypothetical protein TVAG_460740 [Trichomonas vaginalis G3]KAI5505407.1 nerve growth factor signaling pathway [Trichomonas vaginalis G3]|eukprot:XP_001326880.1 hypothetical protein [Trichomonas vaginalis G3]
MKTFNFYSRQAFQNLQADTSEEYTIKLNVGQRNLEVSAKLLRSYSRNVKNDYKEGKKEREYNVNVTISDKAFQILQTLLIKLDCHIEIIEDTLLDLYKVGKCLGIDDFIEWYNHALQYRTITLENIDEFIEFVKISRSNNSGMYQSIINFIAENILDISIEDLKRKCTICDMKLSDNMDFIQKIIAKCAQLGHFQDDAYIDHLYGFLLELFKESAIFGCFFNKFDYNKIKANQMNQLLDLVGNKEYKDYHSKILEMQKKRNLLTDENPKELLKSNIAFEKSIEILSNVILQKNNKEDSYPLYLKAYGLKDDFNSLYKFLKIMSMIKNFSPIRVACAIGISEKTDKNGNTILLVACINNDIELAKILIENKCNMYAENSSHNNAVLCAAIYGSIDVYQFLESNGFDITPVLLKSSFFKACRSGQLGMIKYLKENKGFNIEKDGENCIALAVISGKLEVIKYLISNNANPSFSL